MPKRRPALAAAVLQVIAKQKATGKPLAIILAGHNGSGKSTMWYKHVVDLIRIPLVNADRMMLSVLPEVLDPKKLPKWASSIRDADSDWMQVAQKGVESFVAHAMGRKVPFAQETVFSYWKENKDGTVSSKIDLITSLQQAGYFVLLFFVGLRDVQLSIGRVSSRRDAGGHDVAVDRLIERFPRTQKAIGRAINVADAAILTDNSRAEELAFTICRIQIKKSVSYDIRNRQHAVPTEILKWIDKVCPMTRAKAGTTKK
jgi:predicted ABC-type ATPase